MRITHSRAEQTRSVLMRRLRDFLDAGNQNIIVLVPEQITLQTELDIIDELHIDGTFAIQVMSPNKLYNRVFAAAGEPEGVPIDERGRALLLGAAVSDIKARLKWYVGISDKPGFTAKALAQIGELKDAGVTPDELGELSADAPNPALAAKLGDLALIYAAYAQALSGHFADSADRQRECIKRFEYARFLEGADILIFGFDMITPPIERLTVALNGFARSLELIIALPDKAARDYGAYESVALSLNRLSSALITAGIKPQIACEPDAGADSELDALRHELFAYPVKPRAGAPRAIRLQLMRDPFDEAMEIASQARELARAGMRWRDMAVVSPRMDEYAQCLERAFSLYGVPLFIAESRALAGEPLPRYLLGALRAITHGFRQEDMLDCLKSGFGISDADAQFLENYIEQFGITGRKFLSPFKRGGDELIARAEPIRQAFVGPLNTLKLRLGSAATMGEQAGALFMLLDEQAALESLKARQTELLDFKSARDLGYTRRMREAAYSAQVWNKLIELLDQLYLLLGQRAADTELLMSLMRGALECDEVRVLPQSGDAVAAGRLGGIKLGSVKTLFVIGMQDMPPAADAELLSDAERAGIETKLRVSLGLDSRHKQALKNVDMMSALASARKFIIFTLAMNDFSGAGERPGDAIVRLRRVFPEIHTRGVLEHDATLKIRLGVEKAALEQLAPLSRRGLLDSSLPDAALKAWATLYKLDGALNIERALTSKVASPNLSPELTRRLYHGLKSVSITRLEQHARCPFAEFVRYGLRPTENLKYEIAPRDKGMFYHEAIETFTRRVIAAGGFDNFKPEELVALMDKVTLEMERKWSELIPLGEDSLMRARSRDMIRTAKRAAMAMSNQMAGSAFGPSMLEIDFGEAGELTLKLPDGKLRVRGRIDRVDMLEVGDTRCLRVIDYKLGGKNVSFGEMFYGLQLQLLTYLSAALKIKRGFEPAAALYFAVKDPIIDADALDDGQIERERINELRMSGLVVNDPRLIALTAEHPENVLPIRFNSEGALYKANWLISRADMRLLMNMTKQLICEIAEEIRKGVTDIMPCKEGGKPVCLSCDFNGICHFSLDMPGAHVFKLADLSAADVLEELRERAKRKDKGEDDDGMD